MIDFNKFSNSELVQQTKFFVQKERVYELQVLHALREIESRRLHLEMGFPSLAAFVIEELGYHESTAYRKVDAMRLLTALPEVESSVQGGKTNLVVLSQAQSFFKMQAKKDRAWNREEKLELLKTLEGQSKLETERLLKSLDPETSKPDHVRVISATQSEVKFTADRELLEKLQRIREFLSHTEAASCYNVLFNRMADLVLERIDPTQRKSRDSRKTGEPKKSIEDGNLKLQERQGESCARAVEQESSPLKSDLSPAQPSPVKTQIQFIRAPTQKRTRYILARDRRSTWVEADCRCAYVDPVTGRRCNSRWRLQLEHKKPYGKNGSNDRENLDLYCQSHNALMAIREYGETKMSVFLKTK